MTDFWDAVNAGNMPAVTFLKAKRAQDGHAGYSSPLDEQEFIVNTLNALQQRPEWNSTAVIIAYDDSDGWYDHQMSPILRQSVSVQDALSGTGHCGTPEYRWNRRPLRLRAPAAPADDLVICQIQLRG